MRADSCTKECNLAETASTKQDVTDFLNHLNSLYTTCPAYIDRSTPTSLPPSSSDAEELIQFHKNSLLSQLHTASEPALILHLATLLIFIHSHPGTLIYASGRFVPPVLKSMEAPLKVITIENAEGAERNGWDLLHGYQKEIMTGMKDPGRLKTLLESNIGEEVKTFVIKQMSLDSQHQGSSL
ncbi:hypothetical protein HDV00_003820 [Rhizophlyctis rosea]|nr:hypothetical protein HDV00_003820 [Rhizophlyctis rosea]